MNSFASDRAATAAGSRPGDGARRGIAWRLFVASWALFVLHFATNTVREIYPALTLGDRGSFDVSEYVGLHPDIFAVPGRGAFINNNPGASIVGAIPYAAARPLVDRIVARVQAARAAQPDAGGTPHYDSPWPMAREFYRQARARGLDVKFGLGAGVMQALAMAPLSALSVVVMFWLLAARIESIRAAAALAFLYAIATPVLYRTAQLNHNVLVAHCALFAFATLWRPWTSVAPATVAGFLLAGFLSGWAVVCDYSGAIVVVAMGGYAVARWMQTEGAPRRPAPLLAFGVGVAAAGAILLAYQWVAFGHPLLPPQHYMPAATYTHHGYAGMDRPHLDLLWSTLFSPRYGLFISAPILLLALYPPAWRTPARLVGRSESWCIGVFCLLFLLFCSANQYGRMQFNSGVRHIVPVSPLLFLIAAGVVLRLPRIAAVGASVLAAYWSWCLAMVRDVESGRGIVDAVVTVSHEGVRLPWLTTLQGMGYVHGQWPAAVLLIAYAAFVWWLWRTADWNAAAEQSARAGARPRSGERQRSRFRSTMSGIAGTVLVVAAVGIPGSAYEQALRGTDTGALSWGPALFRALLLFHGIVLTAWGLATRRGPVATQPCPPTPDTRRPATGTWIALIAMSVLALALRLWASGSCLWFDEVLTYADYVRAPMGRIVTSFPNQNQHMLYSVLARVAVSVFGESFWAARLPSVLFGVASVWALFFLGRRLFNDREALLACALLTVSYHHVWFSQNARGYMGLLFFATLATYLWLRARDEAQWRWAIGYALTLALGMWTHLTMVFVPMAHAAVWAFDVGRGRRGATGGRLPAAWLLGATVTLQLYALSLPEFLRTGLHEVSLESEWTNPLWVLSESVRSLHVGFGAVAVLVAGAAVGAAGWLDAARRDTAGAVGLVLPPLLGGATMLLLGHNLWPRFFFFAMGFALLIAVHGALVAPPLVFAGIPGLRRNPRLGKTAGITLAGLMIAASALSLPRAYALPKQDFTGARDWIEAQRRPGDAVVGVGLAGVAYRRLFAPEWQVADSGAELAAIAAAHPRVWLVYTIPVELKAYRPDVWAEVERRFDVVKVFPGTLGAGEVYVCRERTRAAPETGGDVTAPPP